MQNPNTDYTRVSIRETDLINAEVIDDGGEAAYFASYGSHLDDGPYEMDYED